LDTVSGTSKQRYPILKLHLVLEQETKDLALKTQPKSIQDISCYAIRAYETTFPLAASCPILLQTRLRWVGNSFASIPTPSELGSLPSVCLGIEDLRKHPVEVAAEDIPKYITRKFPNAAILRSKITGKLILAGNITRPTTTSNRNVAISNLTLQDYSSIPNNSFPTPKSVEGKARVGGDSEDTVKCISTIHLNVLGKCLNQETTLREPNDLPDLEEIQGERTLEDLAPLPSDVEDSAESPAARVDSHSLSCDEPCMYKLFSTDSETFKANLFTYTMYKADLCDLFNTDASRSLDIINPGRVGCSHCDYRHSVLTDTPLANNSLLSRQLMWVPLEGRNGGIFSINRLFRAAIKGFPSCEFSARTDTLHLIRKLTKKHYTGYELSWRAKRDFLNGHCKFLTPSEKSQLKKGSILVDGRETLPVYLPQHCVYNLLSFSTPARLVSVPNRPVLQADGSLKTYNDLLRSYSMNMNDIELLQISQCLALDTIGVDILDAFKSCSNNYATSIKCLTLALKDPKDGLPTYLTIDSKKLDINDLEVLRWDRATYGINDLPKLYSAALAQCVSEYRKHSLERISEDLLVEVQACLLKLSYCDDLQISSLHIKSVEFVKSRGLLPPDPSEEDLLRQRTDPHFISESYCIKYDDFLTEVSKLYLSEVTMALIKVLAFSNFYLKSIDTRDPGLRATLNSDETLLKPMAVKVPSMERPAACLVHKESGKSSRIFKVSEQRRPAVHPSPIYLTQLSRNFHEDGQLSLKTRHLSLDTGCKNPNNFVYSAEQFIGYISDHKVKMSKRFLYSISGQFYDNLGIQLMGPKSAIKVACHTLHSGPNGTSVGWDDLVGPRVEEIILLAVRWYFLAVNQTLSRINLYNYQSAGHLLVAQSDAGACNHAQMHFLVSFINLNGIYRAKTQLLMAKPYVNQTSCRSIPFFELLALVKSIVTTVQLLLWLDSLGIKVIPCNVLILCDAQTVLIQARGRAALYTSRISHLVAKITLKLMQGKLCPFRNLYFFHQLKKSFHVDLLTKLPLASEIQQTEEKLRDHSWLNSDPSGWDHITRGALPALPDKDLIQDLELNRDYIEEAEQIIFQFRKASKELFKLDSYFEPKVVKCNDSTIQLLTPAVEVQPFSQLILRRMSFGLDSTGSAIRILGRSYFYVKRLQYICRLGTDEKRLVRQRMLKFLLSLREKFSPWCLSVTCNPTLTVRQGSRNVCKDPNHHRVVEDRSCLYLLTEEETIQGGNPRQFLPDRVDPADELPPVTKGPEDSATAPAADQPASGTRGGIISPSLDFPTPLAIKAGLDLEVQELVKSPWDSHCETTFEAFVLQFLCCHYRTDQAYSDKVRVYSTELGPDHVTHWSLGRMQRCRADPTNPTNTGRLLVRLIDSNSVLGRLTIASAHVYSDIHQTHGVRHDKSISYLLQKGIYFRSPKKCLDNFKRNCQLCIVNKAIVGKDVHQIVRTRAGPSEALSTLCNAQCNINSAIVDLCGPFRITCITTTCTVKVWVLVLVNDLGRLSLTVLRDYSSQATLEALLTYSNNFGSLQFLASDDGAHFLPFHSTVSPLETDFKPPEGLNKTWAKLLEGSAQRRLRQAAGSSFRKYVAGRHSCVAAAERLVHFIKVFLTKCHLFKRSFPNRKPNMDLLMFQYFLSKIQRLANSRPLFIHKNMILGVEDIAVTSQLAAPHTGSSGLTVQPGSLNVPDDPSAGTLSDPELFTRRLDQMQEMTNSLMVDLAHHLSPLLLETEPVHKTNKDGPLDIHLTAGDIILDKRNLINTGNLTGSMGRIQVMSEDCRWCLITRVKPSILSNEASRLCNAIKRGGKLDHKHFRDAYITVGRQSTDLFLIAKHQSIEGNHYVTFNQGSKIFDFSLCLAKISEKNYSPTCLPPDKHFQFSTSDKESFLKSPEDWITEDESNLYDSNDLNFSTEQGDQDLESELTDLGDEVDFSAEPLETEEQLNTSDQEEPHSPVRTRYGRISQKPVRYV
jgi:hypothetical protein